MFLGELPDIKMLRPFGCLTYIKTETHASHQAHLETRAEEFIILGVDPEIKGLRVMSLETNKTIKTLRTSTRSRRINPG